MSLEDKYINRLLFVFPSHKIIVMIVNSIH
jgi:hypothetical protein